MKTGVRIVIAVGVGYLLGRTRKLRLALTLAGIGASRRLGGGPGGLAEQGTKLLGSSPELKTLGETVRGRLVEAGKAAAMTAASSQIDALSDRLQERTRSLTRPPVPGRGVKEREEEPGEDEGRPARARGGESAEDRARRAPRRRRAPEPGFAEGDEPEDREERLRPAPPRERPVRRRRPAAEEEEERPRRPVRAAGPPPVRRIRREEPES